MTIRTYKVTLDSKNTIAPEPVFLRQGDKTGAVVIDATLMDNGNPVSLSGLTPMFKANTADGQAVIADSTGFNVLDSANGEFTYQVPSQLGSVDGKIKIAYFSFSDSSGSQSTFNVVFVVEKAADMTKESAKDWVSNLSEIIDQYNKWVNNAHSSWQDFVNENKEIIESIDPGGTLLAEVIAARGKYETLKARLDATDESTAELSYSTASLQQNAFIINPVSDFNKMSVLFKMARRTGEKGVLQSAQKDLKTGYVYIDEQTDDAGTQTINKYDPNTGELITSHNLNLTTVVWFEGNSLYHDPVTDDVMFILPADAAGNWIIYNFDKDIKSDTFKMSGQGKYCIDDSGQYFVTIDSKGMPGFNGYVTGFNFYDLKSVINGAPQQVNYIPVKDGLIRYSNKIQGFQMVNEVIYIGRGSITEWYRTTAVDMNGAVIGDYVWDKNDLKNLLGFSENESFSIESEGISWNTIDGHNVPVLVGLIYSESVHYVLINLDDKNGTTIKYSSGVTVAGLTRPENTGVISGLSFVEGANGANILNRLLQLKEIGTYTFTVTEGNEGLAPEMGSATGMAVIREVKDYRPTRMAATAVDYRNNFWTIYYDGGTWSSWAKAESHVPLWSGSSDLSATITLNKPITPYTRLGILYQTPSGNTNIAYGSRNGVTINSINNGGSSAAAAFYEANISFPTDDTAIASSGNIINLSVNASGNAVVGLKDGSVITVKEIWGMM